MIPRWGEVNWRPIPESVYRKMKNDILGRHLWIHYILHCTYCVIMEGIKGGYKWFTPVEWQEAMIFSDEDEEVD